MIDKSEIILCDANIYEFVINKILNQVDSFSVFSVLQTIRANLGWIFSQTEVEFEIIYLKEINI